MTLKRVFLFEIFPLIAIFILPSFAHAGVFSALAGMFAQETEQTTHVEFVDNIQTTALLKAAVHSDPNPSKGGGDIIVEGNALVPENGPAGTELTDRFEENNGEVSVYVVSEGDTLSQIADMFDVSANTILWANDIKKADLIQPGDTLVILPISGVRHVVKEGDTLKSIADKYDGSVEEILAYNSLNEDHLISVGETIVVPGGAITAPAPKPSNSSRVAVSAPAPSSSSSGGNALGFTHPAPGTVRTQGLHGYNGVDFGGAIGTPVRAAAAGEVVVARGSGWNGGYGTYIVIRHSNGTQTLYAHMNALSVASGSVSAGQQIGTIGNSGRSTGPHLHFEVRGARNPF